MIVLCIKHNYKLVWIHSRHCVCTCILTTIYECDCVVRLACSVPMELGLLKQLQNLDMSNNDYLIGSIPSSLSHFSNLESLHLTSKRFVVQTPLDLSLMSSLGYVSATSNNITSLIPLSFANIILVLYYLIE